MVAQTANRPNAVTGVMSPKPTVVTVVITKYNEDGMSGIAGLTACSAV